MKIRSVRHNNRKKMFEVGTSTKKLVFPFSKAEPAPTTEDPRVAKSPLSKREIVRRLGTSAAQLYRLLDQTNHRKSVDQWLALLPVLNCDVGLVVRTTTA